MFKDYYEEMAGIDAKFDGEEHFRKTNLIKIKYFNEIRAKLESTPKLYILVGREIGGDSPLLSLLTSFDRERLEELKVEFINSFDSLYIEECVFVI